MSGTGHVPGGGPYHRPYFMPPGQPHPAASWGSWYGSDPGYLPPWTMPPPPDQSIQNNAIGALTVSIVTAMCCCNTFGILGAALSGIALGIWRTQPATARKLNVWAWVVTVVGLVVAVLFNVAQAVLGIWLDGP